MGGAASKQRALYRPFDGGEFTVAWLTFKGDAVEDDEHRYVVRKEDLLGSKLFRALFGEVTMQCFEDIPGDVVSKEAFIAILALAYEGNTEDRISYIFTMYNIVYSGERESEGCIAEKDYLYLLGYLEELDTIPKELYAVFEECDLPMAATLTFTQFVGWVRKYPGVMDFLAVHLPPSPVAVNPLLLRTTEEYLSTVDPLNRSPSFRQGEKSNGSNFSSFDFIGGEDSGDDDSDELYDSDQISEMDDLASSLREGSTSDSRDETSSAAADTEMDKVPIRLSQEAPPTPASVNDPFYPPASGQSRRTRGSRSRGVQKMGRNIGKAVGGGISKVGHVGRSILHVGKSQSGSQGRSSYGEGDAATMLGAGYSFSSETQVTKNYVCGYLHKIGDGKWTKRSWHRRWFVLDRQRGILSYYRHNPANHIPASQNGNIVRLNTSPIASTATVGDTAEPSEGERVSEVSIRSEGQDSEFERADDLKSQVPLGSVPSVGDWPQADKQDSQQHQHMLYLNMSHPWYRGAVDLNLDNVSLFFEKSLAKNAPTSFFFQVSTLSLREIESKRGVQYKLCAENESDFDRWTHAIAEAINRKHLQNGAPNTAPVLSHQQLYRQGLLQDRLQHAESHDAPPESADGSPALGSSDEASADENLPPPMGNSKPVPPPIVTSFPSPSVIRQSDSSDWSLEISVEGKKQCMILGFMVNIAAVKLLAGESVLSRVFVCIVITCAYTMLIYNPKHAQTAWNASNSAASGPSKCSDPQKCCLHKPAATKSGKNRSASSARQQARPAPAAGGISRVPSASLSGTFKKIQMGSSMGRSTHNTCGNAGDVAHAWSTSNAETFSVRGPEYSRLRRKQASQPALFEFVAADLVRTDGKVDMIAQRVEFPPELAKEKLFIINAQLPSYGPSVWGDASSDGPGYSLVLYWKIPAEICEELKDPKSTTLRLFRRFLDAGGDTSLTDRFKVIAQVTNQDECGLSGMAKKLLVSHNATPVLTRPQHRIYHFGEGSTEIDVDIHTFSYIARRGIHLLLDKTTKLVIDVAFVLQGETEDELPEQILGCCRLDRVDVLKAPGLPC